MRVTVTLDEKLVADLREATGIENVSALAMQALFEMRQRMAERQLRSLKGSVPTFASSARRTRPGPSDEA